MIKSFIQKYRNMSKVAKAALWFTFATILQKGISFFTVPIFARIMTTEQYGLFNVYLSWSSVMVILATMEFHSCAYLNGLARMESEEEKNELAVSLLDLSFIISVAWLIIYIILRDYLNQILHMPTSMVLLMFAEIFFLPSVQFWTIKQRYTYNYRLLVIRTIMQVLMNAGLGIAFVLISKSEQQAMARILAIAVVQAFFGLSMLIWFFRKAHKIFSIKYWKRGLNIHIPLVPHRLSLTVLSSADRIMIENMISASATAMYSVAYSATMVINIIKLSINDALTPWIYDSLKKENYQTIKKNTIPIMLLVMGMSFMFVLFAPEIVFIVGSKKYMEAIYVIPPVAASVFFTFLYNLFSSIEYYYEKTKEVMIASLFAAIVNIVLNYIFIKKYGYFAAGYTTLVCYILLSVVHFWIMKKAFETESKVSVGRIFNIKAILGLSAIVLISMVFCIFLYSNIVLRYSVLFVLLILAIILRKRIFALFKLLKKNNK